MAFIEPVKSGVSYAPGYFLANNEKCTRLTREIPGTGDFVKEANGGKYVPMGTIFPANGATAEGIVYEDVDVTAGNMPGSVVTTGVVYENRLPETLDNAAKTALEAKGFVFLTEGAVTRPFN